MRSIESYFEEYARSHQHPTNLLIHKIFVPAISWGLFGYLHTHLAFDGRVPGSYVLAGILLIYYSRFKRHLLTALAALMFGAFILSFDFIPNLRRVAGVFVIVSTVFQLSGHRIEGRRPSFSDDLVFLLIGPIWVIDQLLPKSMRVHPPNS